MTTTTAWLPGWPAVRPWRWAGRLVVPLARGERVLISSHSPGGPRVVATERALYHRDAEGVAAWARLGWEQVARAERHEGHGVALTGWAPGVPPLTVLPAPRGAALLALARERIAWTTLIATRVPVGGHVARVAVRRQPGTGHLLWMVALDPATPDTEAVRTELAAALSRLRAECSAP